MSDNYSSFVKNGLIELSSIYSFIGYFTAIAYSSLLNFFSYSYSFGPDSFHSLLSSELNEAVSSFEYVTINVSFDHFLVPTLSDFILFDFCFGSFAFCFLSEVSDSVYFSLFSVDLWSSISYCSFSELTLLSFLFDLSSYLVYFISLNSILLLPCFLGFRFLIFSFDVIHSLGFYSLGFKMDAIPGRINYSFELSTLFKGEHRGFCYELCGTSHSSMLILAISL